MLKILLIEDERASALLLAAMLKKLNTEVVVASHGREGLEQIRKHDNIQLIISDQFTPELDGIKMIKILKRHKTLRKIPCILISADPQSEKTAHGSGCSAWLLKPIQLDTLKTVLENSHIQSQIASHF